MGNHLTRRYMVISTLTRPNSAFTSTESEPSCLSSCVLLIDSKVESAFKVRIVRRAQLVDLSYCGHTAVVRERQMHSFLANRRWAFVTFGTICGGIVILLFAVTMIEGYYMGASCGYSSLGKSFDSDRRAGQVVQCSNCFRDRGCPGWTCGSFLSARPAVNCTHESALLTCP